MYITTEVIITFDPIKEDEAIRIFQAENDMSEWQYSDCTDGISFKRKQTIKVDMRGRCIQRLYGS